MILFDVTTRASSRSHFPAALRAKQSIESDTENKALLVSAGHLEHLQPSPCPVPRTDQRGRSVQRAAGDPAVPEEQPSRTSWAGLQQQDCERALGTEDGFGSSNMSANYCCTFELYLAGCVHSHEGDFLPL